MKQILKFGILCCILAISFSSCCKDPVVKDQSTVVDPGGGDYEIANLGTNETITIATPTNVGKVPSLNAHNGNTIRITFKPKEEYAKYSFNVSATINGENYDLAKPNYVYEYIIKDMEAGVLQIILQAQSTEKDISADAYCNLNIE